VNDIEPYFFLSYARTPRLGSNDNSDPDRWVYKLYRDLSDTILNLTGQSESAGFMDRDVRLGTVWSADLANALASCRVFVPLYSPRYFSSESCGKEWFAFAQREAAQLARASGAARAIVPVLWVPVQPESMPAIARSLPFDSLGHRYDVEGFYGIMKLQRYREDYQLALDRLARRIIEVADRTEVKTRPPVDLTSLESAFGHSGENPLAYRYQLQISVLSLDTSTLPEGRSPYYYGTTPEHWRPYRPDYQLPLIEYAVELAGLVGYEAAGVSFDERRLDRNAGTPTAPGLCLVDPWTVVSPAHQARLRQLDQIEQPWLSVLVPWSSQDLEMIAAAGDLRQGLGLSLGRQFDTIPPRFREAATGIPTLQDFGELFPQMAAMMQRRFLQNLPAIFPSRPYLDRPRLRHGGDPDE
jgi:FxsC-like protein